MTTKARLSYGVRKNNVPTTESTDLIPILPKVADFIKVQWNVDGSIIWWPAKVLRITKVIKPLNSNNTHRILGKGHIIYSKYCNRNVEYGSEEADVQFFNAPDGTVLKASNSDSSEYCSWKISEDEDSSIEIVEEEDNSPQSRRSTETKRTNCYNFNRKPVLEDVDKNSTFDKNGEGKDHNRDDDNLSKSTPIGQLESRIQSIEIIQSQLFQKLSTNTSSSPADPNIYLILKSLQ